VSEPLRPSRRREAEAAYPDVRAAFLLTIGALLAATFVGVLVSDLGLLAAAGIGQAIGIGGVATLAARRVPEPQAARIGLVALPWRAWPLILCLAPAALVASELDNFAYDWSPQVEEAAVATGAPDTAVEAKAEDAPRAEAEAEEAEGNDEGESLERLIDPGDPFNLMEALIVMVGIAPVVEEFLFRGVLQQGLVARLGLARGLTLVALLWTMLRPVPATSVARFIAAFFAAFAMGWLLGVVRIYSRSILGSILLASLWAAIGFASLALEGRVELPGMNVEGTHLPAALAAASLLVVAFAARAMYAEVARPGPR